MIPNHRPQSPALYHPYLGCGAHTSACILVKALACAELACQACLLALADLQHVCAGFFIMISATTLAKKVMLRVLPPVYRWVDRPLPTRLNVVSVLWFAPINGGLHMLTAFCAIYAGCTHPPCGGFGSRPCTLSRCVHPLQRRVFTPPMTFSGWVRGRVSRKGLGSGVGSLSGLPRLETFSHLSLDPASHSCSRCKPLSDPRAACSTEGGRAGHPSQCERRALGRGRDCALLRLFDDWFSPYGAHTTGL